MHAAENSCSNAILPFYAVGYLHPGRRQENLEGPSN
jgi:hypothetical protein